MSVVVVVFSFGHYLFGGVVIFSRTRGAPGETAAENAEALAGAGEREPATTVARAAHAAATRLGAAPLQSALLALARRGRLDLGVDLPGQRALAGLTPRELEVLRLLVEGRSNRQIAEQLFISGKTASVHVTNLLAKLGVHSRLEAAAMARRLGLEQPTGLES